MSVPENPGGGGGGGGNNYVAEGTLGRLVIYIANFRGWGGGEGVLIISAIAHTDIHVYTYIYPDLSGERSSTDYILKCTHIFTYYYSHSNFYFVTLLNIHSFSR